MGKIGKGCTVHTQSMEVISNVRKYFEKEKVDGGPSRPFGQVLQRVSDATRVGLTRVRSICRAADDAEATGAEFPGNTPGKKRPRGNLVSHPDDFNLSAIRQKVHLIYLQGELPTLRSLMIVLKQPAEGDSENAVLFSGSKETLRILLTKHLGFKFQKINQRRHLLERTDVVALRREFLREIRKVDLEKVVFLDETWVNENHSVQKCWQSADVYGLKVPLGKGKRLILLHAGSSEGFIPNAQLLFQSKSGKADYHSDMNADCFSEWFKNQLLPNIKPNSVIVMDNAPYHSVQLDKAPISNTRKKDMQDWLMNKNIPFHLSMLKAELYELIKVHKTKHKRYVIDEMAKEAPYFCRVIRLPPYHCQFNPIERVWANVKQHVAKKNTTYKLSDVQSLTNDAIANVSAELWMNHVQHVKKDIAEYWEKDGMIEMTIEPLIISINHDSDDSESSCSESQESEDENLEAAFQPITY